ncbi:MAG: hypothetical protein H7144_03680 [Burkholderiales bacterium]|nr:hypothetical protein [Phycisphaerae bacterium]
MNEEHPTTALLSYEAANNPHPTSVLLGYVGLKLLGLYLLVSMFQSAGPMAYFYVVSRDVRGDTETALGYIIANLSSGLFGVLLLARSFSLSKWIFRPVGVLRYPADVAALIGVASVAAGLLLMGPAASSFCERLAAMIFQLYSSAGTSLVDRVPIELVFLASSAIQFLIGLGLFLRPRWIVGVWRKYSQMPEPSADASLLGGRDAPL